VWIKKPIREAVEEAVDEIFYLDWPTSQRYNAVLAEGQPRVFGGWYWAVGVREGGPFKSMTAAYVNAWYVLVQRRQPPTLRSPAKQRGSTKQQGSLRLVE